MMTGIHTNMGLAAMAVIMISVAPGAIPAYAQVDVGEDAVGTPCWESGELNLFESCGYKDDYLEAAAAPWVWVTGGYFGMIMVSLFVLIAYIRFRNWVYPSLVGVMYLPVSYFMFPEHFVGYAIILMFVAIGIAIWVTMVRQTKEHD